MIDLRYANLKSNPAITNVCVLHALQFLDAYVLHVVNYLKQHGLAPTVLPKLTYYNQTKTSQIKPRQA